MTRAKKLKDMKVGEFFTLEPIENPRAEDVLIRDAYNQKTKKFPCQRYSDLKVSAILTGEAMVYPVSYFG